MNYSLSEIKVEDGYVGKTMNSVSDNLRINTGEAVGVVVRVKDSEKSKIKTISTTLNEILQKKQNYEVCMYVCMYAIIISKSMSNTSQDQRHWLL